METQRHIYRDKDRDNKRDRQKKIAMPRQRDIYIYRDRYKIQTHTMQRYIDT